MGGEADVAEAVTQQAERGGLRRARHCELLLASCRLTAVVLMAELSGAISLVPVIALGCATATAVGNLFGQGDPVLPMIMSSPAFESGAALTRPMLRWRPMVLPLCASAASAQRRGIAFAEQRPLAVCYVSQWITNRG